MVTKEDLKNEDNLEQCECGSYAHIDHMHQNDEGQNSCPEHHQDWLNDIIKMYQAILTSQCDYFDRRDANKAIKEQVANICSIDVEDLDPEFFDEYLIKSE